MHNSEETNVIYSYTRHQRAKGRMLTEVMRWNGRPVLATVHIFKDLDLSVVIDIWQEFCAWREKQKPRLPAEKRLLQTQRNGKKVWMVENDEALTITYPEDY